MLLCRFLTLVIEQAAYTVREEPSIKYICNLLFVCLFEQGPMTNRACSLSSCLLPAQGS